MGNAWKDGESPLVDERSFTSWAEPGFRAWNPFSPELEFCEAAANLAGYLGGLVIETGAGQGYMTRRVAEQAEAFHVYESTPHMRRAIPDDGHWLVIDKPTFDVDDLKGVKLLLLDSGLEHRPGEIMLWHEHGDEDSIMLMHDAGNGHEGRGDFYTHNKHWALIQALGLPGIRYKNPRGSFLSWKNEPSEEEMEFYKRLLPN